MDQRISRRRLLGGGVAFAAAAAGFSVVGGRTTLHAAPSAGRRSRASSQAQDTAVVQWSSAALSAVRAGHIGPPMVARAMGVLHTCMYDAWAMYDPIAVPVIADPALRRPASEQTADNKLATVSFAAYLALLDLFPDQQPLFDQTLTGLGFDPLGTTVDSDTPGGLGLRCAAAVLDFRHGDGSNQLGDLNPGAYSDYTGYQPVNTPDQIVDPNHWQPLVVPNSAGEFAEQVYIGPHWGNVTPFALTSSSQFRPQQGPAQYGTDLYRSQAQALLDLSANLTDRQKMVTEFWADGPGSDQPPGHWCRIGQFVSRRDGHNLDGDVKLFFILGNAVMDAGIACWESKRYFDYIRPISAVHYLFKDQQIRAWGGPFVGTTTMLGQGWGAYQAPTVGTPAFPEFFSGHSTFSAASAEVLRRFTGSDAFGDSVLLAKGSSQFEHGAVPAADITLSWATFSDAANDAGMSRRWGGIHFEQGDLTGRATGRLVGAAVWDRAQAYITGSV